MSSAAHSLPSDYQPEFGGLSTSSGVLKMASPFKVLDNLSPAKNEEVCVMNGFPKFSDVFDFPVAKPKSTDSKLDKKPETSSEPVLPTAKEAFEKFAQNIVLNFDEQKALSLLNGIVRQAADHELNPEDISNSIQRLIKSAKDKIDFSKIASVLNYRLQNSEQNYASVAVKIFQKQEILVAMSREQTVFRAPLQV